METRDVISMTDQTAAELALQRLAEELAVAERAWGEVEAELIKQRVALAKNHFRRAAALVLTMFGALIGGVIALSFDAYGFVVLCLAMIMAAAFALYANSCWRAEIKQHFEARRLQAWRPHNQRLSDLRVQIEANRAIVA